MPPGLPSTPLLTCFPCPGITQLRFKPAYNPYTEPSMEVFSYHQGQGGTWYWDGEGWLRLPTAQPGSLSLPSPLPKSLPDPKSSTRPALSFSLPCRLEEVGGSREFWALPP